MYNSLRGTSKINDWVILDTYYFMNFFSLRSFKGKVYKYHKYIRQCNVLFDKEN